jgi:hypothetical protein
MHRPLPSFQATDPEPGAVTALFAAAFTSPVQPVPPTPLRFDVRSNEYRSVPEWVMLPLL